MGSDVDGAVNPQMAEATEINQHWQRCQTGARSGFAFAPRVIEKVKCEVDTERMIEESAQVWKEMAAQRQVVDDAADRAARDSSAEERAKKVQEARSKKLEARRKAMEQEERKRQILEAQRKLQEKRQQQELARIQSIERAKKKGADAAKEWRKQQGELVRSDEEIETNVPNSPRPSISSGASSTSSRSSRSSVSSPRARLSLARKPRSSSRDSRSVR